VPMSLELRQLAAECERRAAEFRDKAQDTPSNSLFFLELEAALAALGLHLLPN